MYKLWLLFGALAFTGMFLIYRPEDIRGFALSTDKLPGDTYWYYIYEHVFIIVLSFVAWKNTTDYRWVYFVLLWVNVIDFPLYLIFYKSPKIYGFPWNGWKILIFGGCVLAEQIRNGVANK